MSVKLSNTNLYMKKQTNFAMKREFEEFDGEENKDQLDSNGSSDLNSECSDLENGPGDEVGTALDYTENTLTLQPVADFIKRELLPDFDLSNPFRNQSLYKDGFHGRSPFLLPTQLYKSFLASLGKRRRNVAECYPLYPRNMLFSNGFPTETVDDDNADGIQDSPDEESIEDKPNGKEKAGASSAFVWSGGGVTGGGGQEQAAAQPAAVPTGTSGGGGAQGLVHWMSVMAEHMGGGHHDPSHYALPPWNNGGMDPRLFPRKSKFAYASRSRTRPFITRQTERKKEFARRILNRQNLFSDSARIITGATRFRLIQRKQSPAQWRLGEGIYVAGDGSHNFDGPETGPGRLMVALLIAVMTPPALGLMTLARAATRVALPGGIFLESSRVRISKWRQMWASLVNVFGARKKKVGMFILGESSAADLLPPCVSALIDFTRGPVQFGGLIANTLVCG
ncbi:unnamed protein product, partial [Iphiclides podalirius]